MVNMSLLDFYRGKRVLVTGHTGFKGAWLCSIMIKAGADVIVPDFSQYQKILDLLNI